MKDRLQILYDNAPGKCYIPVNENGIEQTLNEIHVMLQGLVDVRIAELEEEEQQRKEEQKTLSSQYIVCVWTDDTREDFNDKKYCETFEEAMKEREALIELGKRKEFEQVYGDPSAIFIIQRTDRAVLMPSAPEPKEA